VLFLVTPFRSSVIKSEVKKEIINKLKTKTSISMYKNLADFMADLRLTQFGGHFSAPN